MIGRGLVSVIAGFSLLLASCGGGGSSAASNTGTGTGTTTVASPYTPPAAESLSVADVQQIVAQAVTQAQADGHPAVISVVDRVGNVLALFRMTGAPATAHIADAPNGVDVDAQGLDVPAEASAIAKAITGAYLSSSGNAFSTRTAGETVQAQFPPSPATVGLGSGQLFGVQFSQLPCSDLAQRFGAAGGAALIGPKRSPLGLSADPGGFPLYKNGVVVGGVGVEADGLYTADTNVSVISLTLDERIALAGTVGYDAPAAITADTIYVAGTQLIYSDVATSALTSLASANWAGAAAQGVLESLIGYTAGAIIAGSTYGTEASGVRAAGAADAPIAGAFVLSDGAGNNRYPVRAATDGADVANPLTADEVQTILAKAFSVMSQARAAIRNPAGSVAQVSLSVVDTHGVALGLVRAPDAPIFGIDVALQKARSAAFFSNTAAGAQLLANASPRVPGYVAALRSFLGNPAALTGNYAFTDRAIGDLSRPTFPDGTVGNPNGPFSVPFAQANPFATGLQSALIAGNLGQHLAYVTGQAPSDTPQRCTTTPDVVAGQNRMQNGIQIFPGSIPIYRGNVLVGGLGASGDGVNQDELISFLGLSQAGTASGSIGNAPVAIRANNILVTVNGTHTYLDYVICPQSPFVNSSVQTPCEGL